MKKTLTLALSVLLVMALAVPSFAGWIQEEAYYEIALSVNKAATAWAADGVYTPGEYFDIAVDDAWRSSACADDANDQTAWGLDYKLALSWDENYFYTYISFVDPNGHDNTWGADPASMWYSGAIQINHADDDQMGDQRLEYGVGLTSDSNQLISNVWADYLGSGFSPVANEDYIVTVNGDTITYEARTPFSAFTEKEAKEGEIVSACYVLSWGNGQDYCHTQFAEGCTGNGKDAGAFAMVTLAGVGEVPVTYTYPNSGTDGNLITGELIGNETGWGENADAGRAAGFDGNPATFFDPLGVGDGFLGIQASESYILDKAAILSRSDYPDRFEGAMIQGSNDGETWTTLWTSAGAAASVTEYTIVTEFENNTGYTMFRYFNETQHGDVAEVEFYGNPGKVEPVVEEVVEEPVAEVVEVAEEPAAEEVVEAPAAAVVVEEAPQTFDMGIIAAISALVSLAGFAVSKKR